MLPIHRKIESVAMRLPEKVAIRSGAKSITYRNLNETANLIANAIKEKHGAAKEPITLLFKLDGTIGMIASHLAVMKSGNICVGVNGSDPNHDYFKVIKPKFILTDDENVKTAKETGAPQVWNIDELCSKGGNTTNPETTVAPEDVACVHFTSGSTGSNKGVLRMHKTELYQVRALTKLVGISENDRICLFRYNSAGLNDAWLALANGGTLVVFDPFSSGSHNQLADWIDENEITYMRTVATAFRFIISSHKIFRHVRVIDIGAEPVGIGDVEAYRKYFSDQCLFAVRYSCTEVGNIAYNIIRKESVLSDDVVPVGYPLEHHEVLILDSNHEKVPPGESGEIAVKSACLSLGYWNEPELTRQRFINLNRDPNQRAYLTRDMGYIQADGKLVHRGRIDFATVKDKFRTSP